MVNGKGIGLILARVREQKRQWERKQKDVVFKAVSDRLECLQDELTVSFQGKLFKVKTNYNKRFAGGGKRGVITGMSEQSRKRLLEMYAKIDFAEMQRRARQKKKGLGVFITLTYPQDYVPLQKVKRDLDVFVKRMRRRFSDEVVNPETGKKEMRSRVCGTWRLEFQERGSPHLHLLVWGTTYWHWTMLNRDWKEVIGESGYVRTEIRLIRNHRHCMGYVSKYMSKREDLSGYERYRLLAVHLGHAAPAIAEGGDPRPGGAPSGGAGSGAQAPRSFIHNAYSTVTLSETNEDKNTVEYDKKDNKNKENNQKLAEIWGISQEKLNSIVDGIEQQRQNMINNAKEISSKYRYIEQLDENEYGQEYANVWTGRFWGMIGKDLMLFCGIEYVKIEYGKWFWMLKRVARKLYRGINQSLTGFTLFSEDPEKWFWLSIHSNIIGEQKKCR